MIINYGGVAVRLEKALHVLGTLLLGIQVPFGYHLGTRAAGPEPAGRKPGRREAGTGAAQGLMLHNKPSGILSCPHDMSPLNPLHWPGGRALRWRKPSDGAGQGSAARFTGTFSLHLVCGKLWKAVGWMCLESGLSSPGSELELSTVNNRNQHR